jgi:hypothetical protein
VEHMWYDEIIRVYCRITCQWHADVLHSYLRSQTIKCFCHDKVKASSWSYMILLEFVRSEGGINNSHVAVKIKLNWVVYTFCYVIIIIHLSSSALWKCTVLAVLSGIFGCTIFILII